ncbi:phage antirepressor KilAC domain-containing protein [Gallibacterium genomosp. 3]|nr:phage antirepressor KilAC domain-containing protein [Gallibacterium genomosp. 3]
MNQLIKIDNTEIRQDGQGRYCLNDLHRASGGESRHRPTYWLTNQQTQELISEISKDGIPSILTKQGLGTFVCKELVYAYAMWISPKFHLLVIRTFDAVVNKSQTMDPMMALNDPVYLRSALLTYSEKVLELKPKAEAFDRLATKAQGSMNLTNAAKHLQMQPKMFIQFLFSHRWIYKRVGSKPWIAYQDKLQIGYLEHKANPYEDKDGNLKISEQVLVTAKGLVKLSEMLNKAVEL